MPLICHPHLTAAVLLRRVWLLGVQQQSGCNAPVVLWSGRQGYGAISVDNEAQHGAPLLFAQQDNKSKTDILFTGGSKST